MTLKFEAKSPCMNLGIPYLKSWTQFVSYFSVHLSELWHLALAKRAMKEPGCNRYLLFLFSCLQQEWFFCFFVFLWFFLATQNPFYPFFLLQNTNFPSEKPSLHPMLVPHALVKKWLQPGPWGWACNPEMATQSTPFPGLITCPAKRMRWNSHQWNSDHGFCQITRSTLSLWDENTERYIYISGVASHLSATWPTRTAKLHLKRWKKITSWITLYLKHILFYFSKEFCYFQAS